MDKKIKIIIILVIIFLILLFTFLLIKSFSSEKIDKNDLLEKEINDINDVIHDYDMMERPLSRKEIEEVKSLRMGPLANIENKVPTDAKYSIKYIEEDEFLREPVFEITIDAKNWAELNTVKEEALQLFVDLGVSPYERPLRTQIMVNALDWDSFDFSLEEE